MAASAQPSANRSPRTCLSPLERTKILSGQRGESARPDLVHRAAAGNLAVLRRARIAGSGPFAVVVHQRPRLRPVYVEPLAHRVLAIVVALVQRLSGLVVAALDLRRIEFHVIAAPRVGMH